MRFARLTDSQVKALRTDGTRRTITDPATRGLQLRVEPSGRKVWLFRFKFRGEESRITLGEYPAKSLHEARADALAQREFLGQGVDPRSARRLRRMPAREADSEAPRDKHSVAFLAHEFFERHVKEHRQRPAYVRRILDRDVVPEWRGRDARTITSREVIELLDKIVARGAPVMANRTADVLGQMFKYGIHRSIVEDSPVKLLYRPGGSEQSRERVLGEAELHAFLKHRVTVCRSRRLPHVLMILLLTLQRRSELALAEWSEFDFEERLWRIPDAHAKGGRGHTLPLTDWAITELEQLRALARRRSRYVLPNAKGTGPADPRLITRSVARCQKRFAKIGVAHFTPHDLRRTGRTELGRLGVAVDAAERVLNHARDRIEATYDRHPYLDEKRAALEKWSAYLKQLEAKA